MSILIPEAACDIAAGEIAKLILASALCVALVCVWVARDGWLGLVTFVAVAAAGTLFDRIDNNMCMVNEPLHGANSAAGQFLATGSWYLGVMVASCAVGYVLAKTQGWWFSPWFHRRSGSKAIE